MNVNIEEVEFEIFTSDEEEISSMFTFTLHGKRVNGFGFMYKTEDQLNSIWLIPFKRSFSKEYIEEFEAGIIPDYEN